MWLWRGRTEAWLSQTASNTFSSLQIFCCFWKQLHAGLEHAHKHAERHEVSSGIWVSLLLPLPYFELIWDFWHERGDLLHEPVNAALTARFQQRGDGQGGYAAVGVCHKVLQVQVTGSHSRWVFHGHLQQQRKNENPSTDAKGATGKKQQNSLLPIEISSIDCIKGTCQTNSWSGVKVTSSCFCGIALLTRKEAVVINNLILFLTLWFSSV